MGFEKHLPQASRDHIASNGWLRVRIGQDPDIMHAEREQPGDCYILSRLRAHDLLYRLAIPL